MPAHDVRGLQAPPRTWQRNVLSERGSDVGPTFEDLNHYLEQKKYQEGQCSSTTPSSNSGGFVDQGSYFPLAQPAYNPMIDPGFQSQIEATVANMIPGLLQQMQQGASPIRNYAAEAADLSSQIIQQWARGPAEISSPNESNPAIPRKMRADSGYVSTAIATNGEASNCGRAQKKSKGRKISSNRKKRKDQDVMAED
ncbi:hypothetical protein E2P81_ATG11994 [Venturia nashicola]|uniref:Uncharacterized protein n=1 Tax=Venturia nashicola TaxID=86259 RepID=A0A4Z1NQM8_9PEZI|nr:hypothetical protein E6O75_ATG11689 [Venturia nashicola]TLD24658.1 hypothetical protein E2P81_ATG11994 [Venturia nashicola]